MKILFCVSSLGVGGGIGRVTIVKANALAELKGNQVAICYTDKGLYPATIHPLSEKVKVFDLNTRYWDLCSFKDYLLKLLPKIRSHIKSIKKVVREFSPDVIISTDNFGKFALGAISSRTLSHISCMGG